MLNEKRVVRIFSCNEDLRFPKLQPRASQPMLIQSSEKTYFYHYDLINKIYRLWREPYKRDIYQTPKRRSNLFDRRNRQGIVLQVLLGNFNNKIRNSKFLSKQLHSRKMKNGNTSFSFLHPSSVAALSSEKQFTSLFWDSVLINRLKTNVRKVNEVLN